MSFRKVIHDVEEKGLSPNVPHSALGSDGRLLPSISTSKKEPTAVMEKNTSIPLTNAVSTEVENKKQEVAVVEAKKNVVEFEEEKSKSTITKKNALKELAKNDDDNKAPQTAEMQENIGKRNNIVKNDDAKTTSQKTKKVSKKTNVKGGKG